LKMRPALVILLSFLTTIQPSFAAKVVIDPTSGEWIPYTDNQNQKTWLNNFRKPSLYTGDFGDCMGNSMVNVSRFDAALYKDNMTVLVHWAGTTPLLNQSLMLYMAVYAYGQTYWQLPFNPCNANINSLCPMNASTPFEASFNIPLSDAETASVSGKLNIRWNES
jgi:hypothetical protein